MKLTILSVNYHSEAYCNNNIIIFDKTNKNLDYDWYIVDNNLKDIESEPLNPKFKVVPGWKNRCEAQRLPDGTIIECGSLHHGLGINQGISQIDFTNSDLILIADPDFILSETIESIYNTIVENDYAFYGADYANVNKNLIRNFPTAFCLFVNPKFVNIKDLDFRAGFDGEVYHGYYPDCGHRVMYKYKTDNYKIKSLASDKSWSGDYDRYPHLGYHMHMKIHTNQKTLHSTTKTSGREKGRQAAHIQAFRKIYKEIKHGENK